LPGEGPIFTAQGQGRFLVKWRLPLARPRERVYCGAVALDGPDATLAVAVAPGGPDAGRLVALEAVGAELLPDKLAGVEDRLWREERARVRWLAAVHGGAAYHEAVRVPREVMGASPAHKEIACLAGTNWSDPAEVASLGLEVGVQFTGAVCHVAAAPSAAVDAALARLGLRPGNVTTEAIAFVELLRAVQPGLFAPDAPSSLSVLCSHAAVTLVIVERGEATLLRQVGLADAAAGERGAADRADGQSAPAPEGFPYQMPADPAASWRAGALPRDYAAVDTPAWQAALFSAVRQTLELHHEQGGFPGDVERVYVTGAALDSREVTSFLSGALGPDADVTELECSRAVTSADVILAERVAAEEPRLAPVLALLAAGRRTDLLALRVGGAAGSSARPAVVSPGRAPTVPRGLLAVGTAAVLVATCAVGGRLWWVSRARDEVASRLRAESARAEELRAVTAERDANEARMRHTRGLLAGIDAIRDRQRAPVDLLRRVVALLPAGARLTEVTLDGQAVMISGQSESPDDASRFAIAMQAAGCFADITPQTEATHYVRSTAEETGTGEADVRPLVKFTVHARFTPAAPTEAERRVAPARAEP
jgi:Tfp pilus assembly protein PilN